MIKFIPLLLLLLALVCVRKTNGADTILPKVYYLEQGDVFTYDPTSISNRLQSPLQIYCYKGKPKFIVHIWQTVAIKIDSKNDNYVQYDGLTPEDVKEKYEDHVSSWSINFFSIKQNYMKIDPFNQSCIGIDTMEKYKVYLNVIRVDYYKLILLIAGIFLFLSAEKLSKNSIFYYICGVTLGICASFLILLYFISKMFPKKPLFYGSMVIGWSLGVFVLRMLFDNMRVILSTYQNFVVWYILLTGFISLIVCYRWGPVTNKRTKNIIKWMLQLASLVSIFLSSHLQEAAVGQIILLVIFYNFPQSLVNKSRTYCRRRKFPPKVKLMSNDEYYHQGVKETTRALDELREFCSSPKCNQWNTVLKIKDVRRFARIEANEYADKYDRFASFMEGNSHLSDNEILEYESSIHQTDVTDDEEEMYTDEED